MRGTNIPLPHRPRSAKKTYLHRHKAGSRASYISRQGHCLLGKAVPQTEIAGIQTSGIHLDTNIIQECQQLLFLPSKCCTRVTAPPRTRLDSTFITGPE